MSDTNVHDGVVEKSLRRVVLGLKLVGNVPLQATKLLLAPSFRSASCAQATMTESREGRNIPGQTRLRVYEP